MVKGVDGFKDRLQRTAAGVHDAVRAQLEKEAGKIVVQMKRLVPVLSGALRDSIGWTWGDPPAGAMTIGRVARGRDDRMSITIYAGGGENTRRTQRRASGTRRADQSREGTFENDVALYQEFGTVNMPANPFFYPAYRAEQKRVRANLRRAVRRAVQSG